MSRSLIDFVTATAQQDRGQGLFELENDHLLEMNLDGEIRIKAGSMIAYRGDIKFTREGAFERGFATFLKRSFTGEGGRIAKATGRGKLYLADSGKRINLLTLSDETLVVNGNDLLAFEPSLSYDITLMRKLGAMAAGGLFNVRLAGRGTLALMSHYHPLTLRVTPDSPLVTDPNATIAWSGNLQPEFKLDVSFKTFLGRGSGDSVQMRFSGEGFVIVQPFEEKSERRGRR